VSITVSTSGDRTILMARTFDAPRELVFAAHTQAEHLRHWWGRGNPLDVEIDFTVGGTWRFVEHADGQQHAFRGEFREIAAPDTFTWTFEYEPMAGHVAVERYDFTEEAGRTTVSCTSTFDDQADRDSMLASGMAEGAETSYRALDSHLSQLTAQ
jgi:uncharacterized protein YndB with AHSA1/START domain